MRLLLAFLITALMAGIASAAGMYRWQEVRNQAALAESRAALEAQIEDLTADLDAAQRQLLALAGGSGALLEAWDAMDCIVNTDAPSGTVPFTHERSGISFEIPVNPAWGTGGAEPEPYILLSGIDGVLFGRPRPLDDCDWAHTLQLTVLPARTPEQVAADVGERMGVPVERSVPDLLLSEETFGEHTFLSYRVAGACLLQNYELQGEEFNAVFSSCVEDTQDLQAVLPSVQQQ